MAPPQSSSGRPLEKEVAATIADALPELRFIYVFGSAARDELCDDSDYDLAVDAGSPLQPKKLTALSGRLEAVVERGVDIVDLQAAGPIIKMQILRKGSIILCHDERALAEFKMYTPSIYEDWKHLRRPIDEALLRRIQS